MKTFKLYRILSTNDSHDKFNLMVIYLRFGMYDEFIVNDHVIHNAICYIITIIGTKLDTGL